MKQKTGRKLLSFLLTLAMVLGLVPGMGMTAYADDTDTWTSIGMDGTQLKKDSQNWDVENDNNIDGIYKKLSLPAGNYRLDSDIQIGGAIVVNSGTVNFDLNGHGIIASGGFNVFYIIDNGKLSITDSNPGTVHGYTILNPSNTNGAGLATVHSTKEDGDTEFKGGFITGGKKTNGGIWGGAIQLKKGKCTVTVTGCTLIGNNASCGGAVNVQGDGSLSMSGTAIIGNTSDDHGGGVYNQGSSGTVTLTNCTIKYNYAGKNGGGGVRVYNSKTTTIIDGCTITDNACSSGTHGGGIYGDSATIKLKGDISINNNFCSDTKENLYLSDKNGGSFVCVDDKLSDTASIGVSMSNPGVFTNSTTTDYNVVSKFTADNDNYAVGKNTSGQLFLGSPSYTVTFNANGHGTAPDSQTLASGSLVTKPDDLTETGYTFGGWYKESDCTNKWTFGSDTVSGDTTLYAKWTADAATAPTISTQPSDLTLTYGYTEGSVSVSATAATDRDYTLSYQWCSNTSASTEGGTAITDATSESYSIPTGKTAGTTEYYYCVVTATRTDNSQTASTTSNVATVAVKSEQTITADDVTVTYGDTDKSVSGTTSGNGTISYAVKSGYEAYIAIDSSTGALTIEKVGTAYVTVTASETDNYAAATKDVTVTINKADPTVKAPTAENLTYTGEAQTLITAGSAEGGEMQYSSDGATYSTTLPSGTDAGTYTVYYKVVGDDNHNDYGPKTVTVTIAKKNSEVTGAPAANTLKYNGSAQTLITAGSAEGGEMQYSLDGSSYSTSLPSETNAGTYIVYYRVAGDSNHDDVEAQTVSVTIDKRSLTMTSASAEKVYDADPLTKEEVEVSGDGFADGEGAAYTFTGTRTIPGESDNTFTYELNAGTEESNYDIELVYGKLTIKNREDKFEIEVVAKSKKVKYDGSSHSVEGFETLTFTVNDHVFTVEGLTAKASEKNAGTYPVKVSGSEVVLDSEGNDVTSQFTVTKVDGELIINKVKASCKVTAAKDLVYNKKAQELIGSATVKGGTLQYSSDGKNYSEKIPTGTDADKYTVYYRVKADKNHKDVKAESLSVTIDKAEIKITAPTANKLKYNGEKQKLVTEGKTDGGVMEYSLDGSSFGTSVPEAVNIGKYTVYYMAKGDKNYKDSEVMSVQASISKSGDQDDENDENAETLSDETYGVFSGNESFIMSAGDKSVSVSAQGCEGMNMKFELQNVNGGQRLVASTDNYGRNTVFNLSFDESGSNVSADVTCEEYHSKYGQ